jgi:hypothetical protein
MKKVEAVVSRDGEVSIEFIGFKGEECTDERERLRKVMLDFGIMLDPKKIEKKTAQQIAREVAFGEETRVSFRR